jgi:hypothetical protein
MTFHLSFPAITAQAVLAEVARELEQRRNFYPRRIAEARMTQAEARQRSDALAALAARYDDGFDWIASNGEGPRFAIITATPEIEQARREWDEHLASVTAHTNPPQQQELLMT